jgi:hypothetical protein
LTFMNKLSLVGMQLPEKYKENFDVSSAKALRLELLTFRRSLIRNLDIRNVSNWME